MGRCHSQFRDEQVELFCSLPLGHDTLHRGWKRQWSDEEAWKPPPPPPPPPPAWDGASFFCVCQHCKAKFVIEVPRPVYDTTWIVTCPKCRQTSLHWFAVEAKEFRPGFDLRARAQPWKK